MYIHMYIDMNVSVCRKGERERISYYCMFSNLEINGFKKNLLKFERIKIERKVFSKTISTSRSNTRAMHPM